MHRVTRLLVVAMVVGVGLLASAGPVQAHPLGNFTVNRYARVEVSAGAVRVLYVLDLAEIPAFQERQEVGAGPEAYAAGRAEEIAEGLELTVDGRVLDLAPVEQDIDQPAGQGGLTTLRVTVLYQAPLAPGPPDQARLATFSDQNQPERIGWREIVVQAAGDAEIASSDAPGADITDELRTYPTDRLQSPLDRRTASFAFAPGSRPAGPPALDGSSSGASGLGADGFAALVTRTDLTPLAVVALLALALGFGAVHAVGPGHGKTIMAAYLVGTRGRPRDAVALGTIVSVMHTASVLVLGLVLVRVDRSIAAESVYPVLTVISGVAVTGVGGWLLVGRWRRARAGADHEHDGHDDHGEHELGHDDHDDHGHDDHGGHDHDHDDHGGHGHSHALAVGVAPLSRRGLVALGASGGLFPSPSAVLVVVGAIGLGRAGLGLALLAAFSVGLAVTLTVVGLGLVYGRDLIERRGYAGRLQFLPVVGAIALVALGVVVILRGVVELS